MSFDPNLFVAKWYCGLVLPEDIPSFAADAPEAGFDGPALRRLAGLVKPTSLDVGNLFDRLLDEIGGVEVRSRTQAIFKLAKILAQAIVDGKIDPFDGARKLSRYALEAGYPEGLAEFDQLADEPLWGDHARSRALIRADIIAEAKKLLALTPA
ncbi:MAG TPA: hypothetical protein VI488_00790 [Candidatus Angelobacter sp.]